MHGEKQALLLMMFEAGEASEASLALLREKFKTFCKARADAYQGTAFSYSAMPNGDINQAYWDIAKLLFSPKNLQEMLAIVLPDVVEQVSFVYPDLPEGLSAQAMQEAMRKVLPTLSKGALSLTEIPKNLEHFVIAGKVLFDVRNLVRLSLENQREVHRLLKQTYPEIAEKV